MTALSANPIDAPKITAIAPWFGGKRSLAGEIVAQLGSHKAYWEPFCGGLSIILTKPPSSMETVSDLHGDLTNLAWTIASDMAPVLYERLARTVMCDDLLAHAREQLVADPPVWTGTVTAAHLDRAWAFFVCAWMGRNGTAGMRRSKFQMAVRWTPNGGHGAVRFSNAVASLPWWHQRLRRVLILRRDAFDLIDKIDDSTSTAIYCDPPYVFDGVSRTHGDGYLYDFKSVDHQRLALALRRFKHARVVLSYYDIPIVDDLYPGWSKISINTQKRLQQANQRGASRGRATEALLMNGPAFARPGDSGSAEAEAEE